MNSETKAALWRAWRDLEDLEFRWPNDQRLFIYFYLADSRDSILYQMIILPLYMRMIDKI